MKIIGIIPARYSSTRFPGKPLALLGGRTVIERVYTRACAALDDVWVATDSELIAGQVRRIGGKVVMTPGDCASGTERCAVAAAQIAPWAEAVVNIQGDEPFVSPGQIHALTEALEESSCDIATLVRHFDPAEGYEALARRDNVKVVTDSTGRALYFSRSVIPAVRDARPEEWPYMTDYLIHTGMYAYRADILQRLAKLPPSPAERAENLEQLRWLCAGMSIATAVTTEPCAGIDTPEDLARAESLLDDKTF